MENYIAEIRIFPYNRIPSTNGWMPCNGQTLQIKNYNFLYVLIGTYYGGDGQTTFMLPNLNGRTIIGTGVNPVSRTVYGLGKAGGQEQSTLTIDNLPPHNHAVTVRETYDTANPNGSFLGNPNTPTQTKRNLYDSNLYNSDGTATVLAPTSITTIGKSLPHENRMPFTSMIYCIATLGLFPPRT